MPYSAKVRLFEWADEFAWCSPKIVLFHPLDFSHFGDNKIFFLIF